MPRRQYVTDLQKAQSDVLPNGISNLQPGGDDGQFEFLYSNEVSVVSIKVTALIPELSDYPTSHEYMIFSGEEAPPHFAEALQNIRRTNGKTVFELLDIVSATLLKVPADADGDTPMPDSQLDFDEQSDGDYEDDDIYDSDHEAFHIGADQILPNAQTSQGVHMKPADRAFRARIRSDLRIAKEAGFKVGVLSDVLSGFNAFVTVSIRISKLGISEEAMEAWQVDSSDHLILILQYPNGYKTNEELQSCEGHRLQSNIAIRVCVGKSYKATLQDAIKAFTVAKKSNRETVAVSDFPGPEELAPEGSTKETFISKPLNGLLQERLTTILRFRSAGMTWSGAEEHYTSMGASIGAADRNAVPDRFFEPDPVNPALPEVMNTDHYSDRGRTSFSFPLLAMQFLLRHFVRCTEFCLVCHRKMDTELEAIKPYVCEFELCLYQYMTLGFGPSIEHEILAQPYVVDLLVSFCYKSAVTCKLKEYPDGLSLIVPPNDPAFTLEHAHSFGARSGTQTTGRTADSVPPETFDVGIDRNRLEIIFHNQPKKCPVKCGDWIVVKMSQATVQDEELHCRVADVAYFPTIMINDPVAVKVGISGLDQVGTATLQSENRRASAKPVSPAATPKWMTASFTVYSQDFKSMLKEDKSLAICRLLDTLPNVKIIQEYIIKHQPADLKNWVDRISPAALSLLRWIIASNRACIVQVDGDSGISTSTTKRVERCSGMKDHMQFRFAMGAPDKEQRFLTAARETTERLNLAVPTIFAWHGSPLHNWHMIIREGLHYKNTDHGRAYGHGVYHATDAGTSTSYSGMGYNVQTKKWKSSVLCVDSALALNEIVNAPKEYVSCTPYYVVQHLDWIQTRYLFVSCKPRVDGIQVATDTPPHNALTQDTSRIPRGVSGSIVIPASAIKTHGMIRNERRPPTPVNPSPLKKLKAYGSARDKPITIDDDDDAASILTTASDTDVLYGEDPEPVAEVVIVPAKPKGPPTDFEPGTLDFTKLPLMPTPTYATSNTSKRLLKEMQTCQKVQESTPLAELGWFIDGENIENVYQWIVELHSFHTFEIKGKKLPLAEDMKKKGVKSVVMEIRFNKDFPFTPPYVRVITPRFLGFNQGGGGHIVLGGAMCMELLTNTGWSSVSSMESVLMQIRMAIASEPFARLDMNDLMGNYGTMEAADGYIRACQTHGWQVPPGFKEMAYGGVGGGGELSRGY